MKKKISVIITKIFLSIIVLLSSLIFVNSSSHNKEIFKKYVIDNNFNFMKFKALYSKIIHYKEKETKTVSNNYLEYITKETITNGEKYIVDSDSIINSLCSGIVVFIGKKNNINNTVIIQGSDGYDIWYGNLENINVSIYDYVKSSELIGSTNNEFYLFITKDGEYYTYEEYLQNKK